MQLLFLSRFILSKGLDGWTNPKLLAKTGDRNICSMYDERILCFIMSQTNTDWLVYIINVLYSKLVPTFRVVYSFHVS